MEKEGKYFIVGLFVSLTLLALVVFVIWLAGFRRTGDYERYTIYFTDPVSGLDKDSYVKYKGVEVGKILALRLAPDRSDLIKVDIEVKINTPIRAQTVAKVEFQGITGKNYIELATDPADKAPASRMPDEKYPVLQGTANLLGKRFLETLSAIDELSKRSTKTADSIRALTDKLKEDPSQILYPPTRKGVEIPK